MPTWLTNLYHRFFGAPVVEHAIAIFDKAIHKLEEVASHHDSLAKLQADIKVGAQKAEEAAKTEAAKARAVATKIADLVA